jgi:hypothetical protein
MTEGDPRQYSEDRAYVPEQLARYVECVSGAETVLVDDFVSYQTRESLVFVAYPLTGTCEPGQAENAFAKAMRHFRPKRTSLIGPDSLAPPRGFHQVSLDHYYLLDLGPPGPPAKVRNMVTRAGRELVVRRTRTFGKEHRELVDKFLSSQPVERGTASIMNRLPDYLSRVKTAWIFEACTGAGQLAGFTVGEFGPARRAFYMFNFRSPALPVPGASDLLLFALLEHAREMGKHAVNLGLGIRDGVAHFKEKWGARPLLSYAHWESPPRAGGILRHFLAAIQQLR